VYNYILSLICGLFYESLNCSHYTERIFNLFPRRGKCCGIMIVYEVYFLLEFIYFFSLQLILHYFIAYCLITDLHLSVKDLVLNY